MFDAVDDGSQRHFLAVASEKRRAQVLAADNVQALYVDDVNTGYGSRSGAARADALVSYAWVGNQHGETRANRLEAIGTHAAQALP